MKKKLTVLTLLVFYCITIDAQIWNPSSASISSDLIYREGQVAIGNHSSGWGINHWGVGALEINHNENQSGTGGKWNLYIGNRAYDGGLLRLKGGMNGGFHPIFQIEANNSSGADRDYGNIHFNVLSNGHVGINVDVPQHMLHINGDLVIENNGVKNFRVSPAGFVRARQIDVDLLTIPDFVFSENYQLMPLEDLQDFITRNRHLPGIKSETEYQQVGSINVGELQVKLLEKVEELTLYILELNDRIRELESMVENQ